ncbi:DEAD/DEAH box helicase [Pseudogemmatithrix spongiicola]|uniref:DEAD/DEAH box helicase n=1 Tax=Pseudogemmatithrix spongiicola TaxID=3062599 RepID=A0AA49Q7Z8_9BACT|nr:DEAD/DEAH box helicase [Gemmatimonadaceae bacterium 'strain 138']WKW14580.1 DEAD/DEAH box helicase [Gemmatimonadaceae bacterium 'strain 318']
MSSFESLHLAPALVRATADLGWIKPTPIQLDAIPPARDGRDVLACAQTGSGKTGGFLLPLMHRLLASHKKATRALILTPTRELAAQVHADFTELAKHTTLRGAAIFGGVGMGPQESAFRHKVDVIIATPGRLLDHLGQPGKYVDFSALEILVLDEADRMLDMGFLPAIKQVLRQIPSQRQTLFFSATLPAPIVELSKQMLKDPARLNVERVAKPAAGIEQAVWPVKEALKPDLFLALLKANVIGNVICFTRTKHRTNRLAEILTKAGVPNARIHGNRSQAQRTEALANFKDGKIRVLVATDIVARGIDVEALEHVLNFDVPHMPEDYIHRVGRTARAEATGEAFTLVSPEEEADLKQIEKAIHKKLPRRTLEGFDYGHVPVERFEVPLAERIAAIRARKKEERERAKAKLERKAQAGQPRGDSGRSGGDGRSSTSAAGSARSGSGKRRRRRGGSGRGPGGGSPGGGSPGGGPYRD